MLGIVRAGSILGVLLSVANGRAADAPKKAAELYVSTQVWNIHLTFTPEQWEAMEPAGGGGGFFGGPGRPGGPGGPGGGNRPGPGGPGGFGPAMFLAPTFLRDGDTDKDKQLSREEFTQLGEKWFGVWDKTHAGKINANQLRSGLNVTMAPPGMGGPGGPGGPGPANGPRRMGGGMNLQGPEGKRNGLASAAGVEFKYVHADLNFEGREIKDVAVRYKGNGTFMESRGSKKRSMKIALNEYHDGQKLAGVTKLNLHNNVTDGSWMNEVLSHKLYRDAGLTAPRSAYARIYITVPGKFDHEYFGLYSIIENIDKNFIDHAGKSKKGALFKPVTPNLFADLGDEWKGYKQTYDPKTDLSDAEKQRMIELCKLVSNAPEEEFQAKIGSYIDLDEFARYMSVMVFLSDLDGILGPGQNFYLYLNPKSNKFEFIPWDQDHSFGQFPMRGTQEQREQMSIKKPWQGENFFLGRIYKVEGFQTAYKNAIKEYSKTIFQPERFAHQVDELATAIRPAVADESPEKLKRFDSLVAGHETEAMEPGFGGPRTGDAKSPEPDGPRFPSFGPTKPIKPFVKIREESILAQLAGKSEGQEVGGFGFPGGRGPGGPGGGRGPGPDFGPGMFLGGAFMTAMDQNKDGFIDKDEAGKTFAKWFDAWNSAHSGKLSDEELRNGINQELSPFRGGRP